MIKKSWCYLTLMLIFLIYIPATAFGVSLNLKPQEVQIGTFYDGTTVEATGTVPADCQAVVLVRGAGEDVHLKKKGKIGGLLWMNIGDVTFEHTPRVYMIYADADLPPSLDSEIGFSALKNVIKISPAGENKDFLFKEFVKLKKHSALYTFHANAISYGPAEGGSRSFKVSLIIPPHMHQGSYTVQSFAVRDGHVVGKAAKPMQLKLTGLPAKLSKLAFGHPLLYGIIAAGVALAAGLLIGVLFGSKGGAH